MGNNMSEFRVRKIPKDEETMREIVDEISRREATLGETTEGGGGEEAHAHESHGHGHGDPLHEQLHALEYIASQLSQVDAKLIEIDRGIGEVSSKLEELVKISRALLKISLAGIVDNREIKRKLIEDVMEEI